MKTTVKSYVHHVNVDEAGIFTIDAGNRTQIGPGVELKQGGAAAIRLRGKTPSEIRS